MVPLLAQTRAHASDERLRWERAGPWKQNDELVATETRHDVLGPDRVTHHAGDLDEHLVAREMPGGVVHRLQPVDVTEGHREDVPVAGRGVDLALESLHQAAAIHDTGEIVVAGQAVRLREELGIRDRDGRLRRVETHQSPRVVGETARGRRVHRQASDDLALRHERDGDGRRYDLVELGSAVRVLGVSLRDDEVAALEGLEGDATEGLADGVAQLLHRALVQGADDEGVVGIGEGQHRARAAGEAGGVLDHQLQELIDGALASRRKADLIQRLELASATALDLAQTPVRIQRQAGASREHHGDECR